MTSLKEARSADEMCEALKDQHPVFAFLLGVAQLEGRWFGDEHKPAFWWRKHLVRALLDAPEGREGVLREAWNAINAAIKQGPLPGNGTDPSAQRNGLIMASNIVNDLLSGTPPGTGEGG